MKRLLLISNSTLHGQGFLDHAMPEIRDFLSSVSRLLFVPYAMHDYDEYAAKARQRFGPIGLGVDSVHEATDQRKAVKMAEAIFVGGGNTFRLLKALYDWGLLEAIRLHAESGAPYIGASAGSNVASPTIKTTNDMPIVEPPSLDALDLVSFQVNPHYVDPDPASTHMGETREERIMQFLEENSTPVLGLREGSMVRVESADITLKGTAGARLFRRGQAPLELSPGAPLNELLR